MKLRLTRTVLSLSALALFAAGGLLTTLVVAGPLDPPAGPVAPTFKTLTEVEPRIAINATNTPGDADSMFKITQPGSYYLTGNIQFSGGVPKHGIEIAASGVTLDLNGFEMLGTLGSLNGVTPGGTGRINLAVVNGSIRNWAGSGVDFDTAIASNCRVDNLQVSGAAIFALAMGSGSTVTNCSAHNSGGGIFVGNGSSIINCAARSNINRGISTSANCSITGCNVTDNRAAGILAGPRCVIRQSVVSGTIAGPGVLGNGEGIRIEGSTISDNATFGVLVNLASALAELAIVDCTVNNNAIAGVLSDASTQILDSVIASNGTGIVLTSSCLVRGCTINSNVGSGIELTANANVVMNNTLSSNAVLGATTAGILVQGTDNTIDGNRLFSNPQGGIKVNAGGNLVLRNYLARTGATITAVGSNAVAQILSPGAGFISTDPNANLTY